MKKERKELKVSDVLLNEGQLDWLPRNPRTWTQMDIDRTAASIREDEDFLEERPILVVPFNKLFIAFAGNLRHEGCQAIGKVTAPCVVHYPVTKEDYETIKRRAMKDNGSFGAWDYDELANNWDDLPLSDWGIPAWKESEGEIDIDGLFNEQQPKSAVTEPVTLQIIIPDELEYKKEDIRSALEITLEQFAGCFIK